MRTFLFISSLVDPGTTLLLQTYRRTWCFIFYLSLPPWERARRSRGKLESSWGIGALDVLIFSDRRRYLGAIVLEAYCVASRRAFLDGVAIVVYSLNAFAASYVA
jgi:hypothetical protein